MKSFRECILFSKIPKYQKYQAKIKFLVLGKEEKKRGGPPKSPKSKSPSHKNRKHQVTKNQTGEPLPERGPSEIRVLLWGGVA